MHIRVIDIDVLELPNMGTQNNEHLSIIYIFLYTHTHTHTHVYKYIFNSKTSTLLVINIIQYTQGTRGTYGISTKMYQKATIWKNTTINTVGSIRIKSH